ncbi:hypothetical protein [Natronobacterium gregoryi]|uniref:Uncharacterized protein n=2 Tax=Natronobacterium gregoryi TaxID=44930 RepID=L0ACY8_NATGS|nr:hypothetical protein [Natronobacterium gregoryi]AFZ71763.1 hypothetical protein Natgr_0510 [Natronobacterium gregoryi SP2]ELY72852.1 hypothetical protein C490_02486 [Natronobacterium gregoryi SP2]PLK21056.1 hypothetical protein CYV19_06385 [Natronobacterium gregoryi SP2]SFI88385.1 hypothetical protein SAMN05443661_10860 [Natronobacterium gregoryi]
MTESRTDALDCRSYLARSQAVVDTSPPATRRATRRWLVEPLLEVLGWAVGDDCVTDYAIADTTLEYVASIEGVPSVFVAVESADESLVSSRANAVRDAMASTGVDRGMYTNGREYLLFAGSERAAIAQLAFHRSELAEYESTLAHYSRPVVAKRLERADRSFVGRQLAVERTALVDAISNELSAVVDADETHAATFDSATDQFVAELISTLSSDAAGPTLTFEDANTTRENDGDSDPATRCTPVADDADESAADRVDDSDGDADERERIDDATGERDGEDGEYVVRFFNDRGSIGAIGHSSSSQALLATAEYLFERGLSGVNLPWGPGDDGKTVLNDEPTRADGTSMDAPRALSNGCYLETAGDVPTRARRAKALAARAGLRAMLTGDWGDETA